MGILILLLLLIAAMAGVLGIVLKVVVGLVVGIVLTVTLLAWYVRFRIRRALYGRGPRGPQWRRVPGSRIEVLDRPHTPDDRR